MELNRVVERPTLDEIQTFQRDGVVLLRGLLSATDVALAKSAIDGGIAQPGPMAEFIGKDVKWNDLYADDAARREWSMFQDQFSAQRVPQMKQLACDTDIGRVIAQLMGSTSSTFFYDHVICKKPVTVRDAEQTRIPWHQDLPYWKVDGSQIASMWIPVDSMTTEAAVTYIPGSHKWGLFRPRHFVDSSPYAGTEQLDDMPNIDEMLTSGEIESVAYAVEPGDVLAFDARVIHGSKGHIVSTTDAGASLTSADVTSTVHCDNKSDDIGTTDDGGNLKDVISGSDHYAYARIRAHRRVALRFLGDDATYCDRPGETAIPPPDMTAVHGKKHGDPLTCELFPKVWPKS